MMTPDEISTQVDLRSRWHRKAILCVVLVVVLSLYSIKFDGDFLKEKGKIPAKQTGSTEIPARGYTTALKSVYSKANIQNPSSNSTSNRSEMPVSSPMPALLHTPANKDNTRASTNVPSSTFLTKQSPCFRADSATTESLLLQNRVLSKPIINVGMPKCGSSTLEHFFSLCRNEDESLEHQAARTYRCVHAGRNKKRPATDQILRQLVSRSGESFQRELR